MYYRTHFTPRDRHVLHMDIINIPKSFLEGMMITNRSIYFSFPNHVEFFLQSLFLEYSSSFWKKMLGHRKRTQTVYYWRDKTPPTSSEYEYLLDGGSSALLQSEVSLLVQAQAEYHGKEKKSPPRLCCVYSQKKEKKRRETEKGKWRGNWQNNLSIFKATPSINKCGAPLSKF